MFTGIIEEIGTIRTINRGAASAVLTIAAETVLEDVHLGDSIAVNGVCLTVTSFSKKQFTADVMHETLNRSSLGTLRPGSHVNLERAMKADGRFGGHIVSGHIDGTGTITDIKKDDNAIWYTIKTPPELMRFIIEKGSITIDGISMTLMQTDASINPGNSGGGLFNDSGELIGIVNAKSASVEVEGLGFAIPVDSARPVITDLVDLGYVTGRPYIGITMQDVSLRYGNSNNRNNPFSFYMDNYVTRVQVMSVESGSAAEKGGLLVNDILMSLNGKEITGSSQFAAMLYEYKVGDTVTITVLRGNETKDLTVVLGERS